jgi:oxygen-independent coproporphyrinogen-3 oxidase
MTDLEKIMMTNNSFKRAGIKKINLDIMYGFPNQSDKMLEASIMAIGQLDVEQVTLYEMRYNQNHLKASNVTRKKLYDQYCCLYNALTEMGYKARFGQNTFSKNDKDEGVSSYLRYRMRQCVPYKGFGVSAQSMSMKGLSYNSLKGSSIPHLPKLERIEESYIYELPREEVVGKYVCVSLYNGGFDLDVVSRILGAESDTCYQEELCYLTDRQLITIEDRRVNLTPEGFEYYAVVAAFFWSKSHRKKYLKNKI